MNYEFIYTSVISPTAHPGCIADIVRTARARNRELNVTGILIFDGNRFCQYLEGPRQSVEQLAALIERDPRHVEFRVRHRGDVAGARRFSRWSMAYAIDSAEIIDTLLERPEAQMPAYLTDNLSRLDMEPGAA